MSPTFTVDDIGKRVESESGEVLGTVVAVDDETAVDPDPDATGSVKSALAWQHDSEDPVPLGDDSVSRVTDEAIELGGIRRGGRRDGSLGRERPLSRSLRRIGPVRHRLRARRTGGVHRHRTGTRRNDD
ncbi:hypothetical protein [Halosolutus gelatinilyticus]|uniref:hypothetical protein n=1 Tax=Halosolutus gelatinilyticus TaxID=2931975 RepID=UPI001FF34692|nr:hypothetical protein [Halosolutus gelatinilyticus]